MEIRFLNSHPEYAMELARLQVSEWAHLYADWNEASALAEFAAQHTDGTLPTTLIACAGDKLLGSVSLIHDDLPGWEALNPWLASFFVLPAQRRRGIGGTLLRAAEGLLVAAGITTVYLFTEQRQAWFGARGWLHHADAVVAGYPATIMRREL